MKIDSRLRASFLAVMLWTLAASAAHAQIDYRIVSIHPFSSHDDIKVGSAWRKDLPQRMQVSLQVTANTPANSIFVKAYFYDQNDKQIASYPKPSSVWTETSHGMEEVGLPPTLPRGITNVYFALPEDLQAKKWKTILVVFGDKTQVAASALPATAMARLNFRRSRRWSPPRSRPDHCPKARLALRAGRSPAEKGSSAAGDPPHPRLDPLVEARLPRPVAQQRGSQGLRVGQPRRHRLGQPPLASDGKATFHRAVEQDLRRVPLLPLPPRFPAHLQRLALPSARICGSRPTSASRMNTHDRSHAGPSGGTQSSASTTGARPMPIVSKSRRLLTPTPRGHSTNWLRTVASAYCRANAPRSSAVPWRATCSARALVSRNRPRGPWGSAASRSRTGALRTAPRKL